MAAEQYVTEAALEGLGDAEKDAGAADLFPWVENGPPPEDRRTLWGAELIEDDLPLGFRVAYFVDESVPYVAVIRVRWPWKIAGALGSRLRPRARPSAGS
ncbi:MAG: hypothetical protein LC808_21260 [Actinobacteria bacterium]|nr:hypothetical protein [Actinomycetota bacterium]